MLSQGSGRGIGEPSVSPRTGRAGRRRAWVWRLSLSALLVAGLTTALAAGASSRPRAQAAAACLQWDVTGTWQTLQSNVYHVTWAFSQQGTTVRGSATLPPDEAQRAGYTGNVVGQITSGSVVVGNFLDVVVQWPPKTDGSVIRGRYTGTVTQELGGGRIYDGRAWDLANPGAKASFTGSGPAHCTTVSPQVDVPVMNAAKSWGAPVLGALPAGASAVLQSPTIAKGQTDASVKVQTPGDGAGKTVLYAPLRKKECLFAYFGGARFKDHILERGSYAVPWTGKDLFENEKDPTLRTFGLLACLEVAKLYEQFKAQGARAAARSGCGAFALRPKLLGLDRTTSTATYRMVRPSKRRPSGRLKVSCRAVKDGLTLRVRTRSRRTKLRSVVGPRLQVGVYRSPAATGEGSVLAVFKR